jgi:class 3 adenylate cyclase
MSFEELLDRALALLQRRGRVTYRTRQRQFALDDAALEDLKDALVCAHPQVVDDRGRGLRWRGEPTAPLSPPAAERRQLTILFCDLVGSTPLAERLDPEDLREVVRAYRHACAGVIQGVEGHVAQWLGDGLLASFGWPQAHDDDARRAVQAGLGLVEALGPVNARLQWEQRLRLAVRVGVHTDLVVVGAIGGGREEPLALRDTPNMAARLQGQAAPDTVLVSDATRRLVHGYFAAIT